jgi:hypothetical protein
MGKTDIFKKLIRYLSRNTDDLENLKSCQLVLQILGSFIEIAPGGPKPDPEAEQKQR